MSKWIYLNGEWLPKDQAKVSVFDHGLLYGDGVFEGIRAYNGLVFKLKEHLSRLWESAHTLMIEIPMTKKQMEEVIVKTLQKNELKDSYIRVVVTRGEGDLGLDPANCKEPTVFVIVDKIKLYPETFYRNGLSLVTVPTVRNLPEAINPSIKSLNYLNNILAKIEAKNAGCVEAIMLNHQGYVAECTGDNIFIVRQDYSGKERVLITPPVYLGALRGITRDAIMELAQENKIRVEERVLTRHDIFNAEEVFLTGTAAEVIPVVKVDGRVIGLGKPGKTTKALMQAFHELTRFDGVRFKI